MIVRFIGFLCCVGCCACSWVCIVCCSVVFCSFLLSLMLFSVMSCVCGMVIVIWVIFSPGYCFLYILSFVVLERL